MYVCVYRMYVCMYVMYVYLQVWQCGLRDGRGRGCCKTGKYQDSGKLKIEKKKKRSDRLSASYMVFIKYCVFFPKML